MSRFSSEFFVTTMDYMDHPQYAERGQLLQRHESGIKGELKFVLEIFRAAKNKRILLLDSASGSLHPDLLAALCIGLWRRSRRPMVIMIGALWHKDDGLPGLIQKMVLRLADRAIFRYATNSKDQFEIFSKAWGISKEKLRFLPYFYTFTQTDLLEPTFRDDKFIFAGGNSHRDYGSLLKAIEALPEYNFVIASHLLDGMNIPSNLQVGQVPRKEFIRLMCSSSVVIIPILKGLTRSVGQQTYLNAMLLEKPVIVTDTLGVRDHIKDGESAFIVDGTPESYIQALRRIFDPENQEQIKTISKTARQTVLNEFSFEKHCQRLLQIVDEAFEEYCA